MPHSPVVGVRVLRGQGVTTRSSTSPGHCHSDDDVLRPGSLRNMTATVGTPSDVDALLDAPLAELAARAAACRNAAHGARVTFSPKVFIPLTMLCRAQCGYCTFAKPPAHVASPYLELD